MMDIRFEVPKIESYSRALAEKICNEFYLSNEAIRGEQIVKLTPIDQVNLFVLKNLFSKWREEAAKLKSPYFNYETPEVKEALQNVLNKLSQNIYIRKEFFKPLLEKAILDTLFLLLKPQGYFTGEYGARSEVSSSELIETQKFYKIYKEVIDTIVLKAERENKVLFRGSELATVIEVSLKEVSQNTHEREKILDQFSSLLKLELDAPQQPETIQPAQQIKHVSSEEKPRLEEEKPKTNPTSIILNEKFGIEQRTVNDLLKKNEATLAEKISKSKVQNIRGAISLSQKFLFINSLFKGQSNDYEKALSEIDQCENYDQALSLLNDQYASKYKWDFNQYEVKEFVEIVERKFS